MVEAVRVIREVFHVRGALLVQEFLEGADLNTALLGNPGDFRFLPVTEVSGRRDVVVPACLRVCVWLCRQGTVTRPAGGLLGGSPRLAEDSRVREQVGREQPVLARRDRARALRDARDAAAHAAVERRTLRPPRSTRLCPLRLEAWRGRPAAPPRGQSQLRYRRHASPPVCVFCPVVT